MKIIILILLTARASAIPQAEYQVSLSYYPAPGFKEWIISIVRVGDTAFIDVKNFRGITSKKKISTGKYLDLLHYLNSKGIWILRDHHRKNSQNGYYLIEVKTDKYLNSFRVEHGIPLIGKNTRYLEIIRHIKNTAKLLLYE